MNDLFKKEEKKVEYIELIYDLMFVYMIGRNNSLIHHIENGFIAPDSFLTYILCTLIVIQIWSFMSVFINRYGNNSWVEHLGIFAHMYLLYYMAEGTRLHWQDFFYQYNIAWALILLTIITMHYAKLRTTCKAKPWEQVHIRKTMRMHLVQIVIILAAMPVYALTGIPLTPLAMVYGILSVLFGARLHDLVEVDFGHLAERAMLYVVFTFGEMIIAISGYFDGKFTASSVYFSLMAFLIVVGLFTNYEFIYDHLLDRELSTNGNLYMLIHVFLIFGLNNITAALEFMQEEEVSAVPKNIFLVASFLIYYIFLFTLANYSKGKERLRWQHFVPFLGTLFCFIVLMAVFYRNARVSIAVSVLLAFAVFRFIYRYWKTLPQEEE